PAFQPPHDFRKLHQSFFQANSRRPGGYHKTHFIRPDGCNHDLAIASPVNFHKTGPGRYAEMLAEPVACFLRLSSVQTGPFSHLRVLPICSDNPATLHSARVQPNLPSGNPRVACSPEALHSRLYGSFHQGLMQDRPANAKPIALSESALCRHSLIDETDSAKRNGIPGTQIHA